MKQFSVPQFIDIEDKIIGPLTVRQFLIMLSWFIITAVCYKLFDFALFVIVGVVLFAIFGTFAFAKVNGQAFHLFFLNLTKTFAKPNLRAWNNQMLNNEFDDVAEVINVETSIAQKDFDAGSLAELAMQVDTSGKYR